MMDQKRSKSPANPKTPVKQVQGNQRFDHVPTARVFQLLLAFRLLNALTIRTFFQPDEYYQALEPAWYNAFGAGGSAWITWEWREHLRSSLHPFLFSCVYQFGHVLASLLGMSPSMRAELLLALPKVSQALIAAIGDFYTWELAKRVYGRNTPPARAALALTVVSPWQWFCSTRTFSNCLESVLTVIALCHWPFSASDLTGLTAAGSVSKQLKSSKESAHGHENRTRTSLQKALVFAALATILRPTNAVIWANLTVYSLLPHLQTQNSQATGNVDPSRDSQLKVARKRPSMDVVLGFIKQLTLCGTLVVILSGIRDFMFYKSITFPPYNFLVFNVVKSLSVFYGNNDWHYYLSQGYPLLLTTALPFMLVGLHRIFTGGSAFVKLPIHSQNMLKGLSTICISLPAMFSVLSHKEVRFIYPLLPVFHVISAQPLSDFFGPIMPTSNQSVRGSSNSTSIVNTTAVTRRYTFRRMILVLMLGLNVLIAIYTTQIHNMGLIQVTTYIRTEFSNRYLLDEPTPTSSSDNDVKVNHMTVAFLMPCHSVPWRSHLQHPPKQNQSGIAAWALTCEPPLHILDPDVKRSYQDEADIFYNDPKQWIRNNMDRNAPQRISGPIWDRTYKRAPGIYTDPSQQYRNQRSASLQSTQTREEALDITDLLPHLITSPSDPAQSESQLTPTSERKIKRPWPHYLIFFQHLEPLLTQILRGSGYRECWRVFNSHWHDDWRRTGDVVVWCLWDGSSTTTDHNKHNDRLPEPKLGSAQPHKQDRGMPEMPHLDDRGHDSNVHKQKHGDARTDRAAGGRGGGGGGSGGRQSSGQRMLAQLTEQQNRDQKDRADAEDKQKIMGRH